MSAVLTCEVPRAMCYVQRTELLVTTVQGFDARELPSAEEFE